MLHDTIRRIRETRNMTQEEVAERLNLAVRSYIRLESGETRLDWDRIRSIAEVYQMSPEDLIAQDSNTTIQSFSGENYTASPGHNHNGPSFHCHYNFGDKEQIYDQLIAQLREEIAFLREELARTRRGEG